MKNDQDPVNVDYESPLSAYTAYNVLYIKLDVLYVNLAIWYIQAPSKYFPNLPIIHDLSAGSYPQFSQYLFMIEENLCVCYTVTSEGGQNVLLWHNIFLEIYCDLGHLGRKIGLKSVFYTQNLYGNFSPIIIFWQDNY